MGFYINPKDMTKEEFLRKHGTRLASVPERHRSTNDVLVCLVDNGAFTAAGICYSQSERDAFAYPDDTRPKQWWSVPISAIEEFMHGQEIEP